MTSVLITGASGQLGRELVCAFADLDVIATDVDQIDVCNRQETLSAIASLRPDIVVHAAAVTDVDGCEATPDLAFAVNALGTRNIAAAARTVGAYVVYVSTDYVFDGTKATAYDEWDTPNPLSVYGRSKLGGEHELDAGSAIVRTSWLFGVGGANVVKTVLRLAAAPGEIRFVDDQHGCPTSAADLASAVRRLAGDRMPGTFHVTNQGATTWWQFARDIVTAAGGDPGRVQPISTQELGRPAPRPANSVLENAAMRLAGMPLLPDHREALERVVTELLAR